MQRLGDTDVLAGRERRRIPVGERTLDRILAIPHTMTIRARLAVHEADPESRDSVERRGLEDALVDALDRDRLASERLDGCWCYGLGGSGERAVMVAGEDVPMVLSVYCPCPAGRDRRKADAAVRELGRQYAEQLRVQSIWDAARIPDRFDGCTLSTFPVTTPKVRDVVRQVTGWLEASDWALVLRGPYGVGKTGLGIGLLRYAAERRLMGLFVKAPDLLSRIRATYGKTADLSELEVLESLRSVPLLMVDDIGSEKATDWATSMLFQVLDDRHDNQRKTILTTNLDMADLALHLGERTMHRFDEGATFVLVDGPNLRRETKNPRGS